MSDLKQELYAFIAEHLKINQDVLNEESALGKVDNWDSIGHLNLMVKLGEKYGFEVDAGILAETQSITEILSLIQTNHT